jgi:hypothetical protein
LQAVFKLGESYQIENQICYESSFLTALNLCSNIDLKPIEFILNVLALSLDPFCHESAKSFYLLSYKFSSSDYQNKYPV